MLEPEPRPQSDFVARCHSDNVSHDVTHDVAHDHSSAIGSKSCEHACSNDLQSNIRDVQQCCGRSDGIVLRSNMIGNVVDIRNSHSIKANVDFTAVQSSGLTALLYQPPLQSISLPSHFPTSAEVAIAKDVAKDAKGDAHQVGRMLEPYSRTNFSVCDGRDNVAHDHSPVLSRDTSHDCSHNVELQMDAQRAFSINSNVDRTAMQSSGLLALSYQPSLQRISLPSSWPVFVDIAKDVQEGARQVGKIGCAQQVGSIVSINSCKSSNLDFHAISPDSGQIQPHDLEDHDSNDLLRSSNSAHCDCERRQMEHFSDTARA